LTQPIWISRRRVVSEERNRVDETVLSKIQRAVDQKLAEGSSQGRSESGYLLDVQKEKKVEKIVSDAFKHSSQLGILIHGASRERHPVNFVFNIRSCPDAA
jgi:enoyl-[acyl-carrier-protein] reductase (NADH)